MRSLAQRSATVAGRQARRKFLAQFSLYSPPGGFYIDGRFPSLSSRILSMLRSLWMVVALGSLLALGCGGGPRVVKVAGVVTLDGRPLEGASLAFQPIVSAEDPHPGPSSSAKTDAEGRYHLELADTAIPGAVAGKHRVTIASGAPSVPFDDAGRAPPDPVPEKYRSGMLEFTVPPEGTTSADFHMLSDRGPPRK